MHNPCRPELGPGIVGNLSIIAGGRGVRHPCRRSFVQTRFKGCWPVTAATWVVGVSTKMPLGSALAVAALALSFGAPPAASAPEVPENVAALQELGKNFFFDKQVSTPRGKQACASCHDPRVGWTLPLGDINRTSVGAPGAQPGTQGGRKPQNNSYVQGFLGAYTPGAGGALWDGRAEGCGASTDDKTCQVGEGDVSETITPTAAGIGASHAYFPFLGPVADQALNPTVRPGVEQNTREKSVCQMVRTSKYNRAAKGDVSLFEKVWGAPIDCSQQADPDHGGEPFFHISFVRLAVAVAAWQGSDEVNSFTSRRDACIRKEADPVNGMVDSDGVFPCDNLSQEENLGHELFKARCAGCHANADGDLDAPDQIYTKMNYRNIALPFNRDLSRDDEDPGLQAHDIPEGNVGLFKTPSVRNVGKNQLGITKAYMHNGYFKNLPDIVHYYNTRFAKTFCEDLTPPIIEATAAEAIANDCWPVPEFPDTAVAFIGNMGLTEAEEAALVAFLETLSDERTPSAPSTVK